LKLKYYLLIILIIFLFTFSAAAAEVSLGTADLDGHTQYIIQGEQNGGFKSELIFPLEQQIYHFDAAFNIDKYFVKDFKISLLKSKESYSYSGKFLDSDWLYSRYGDEKAIYSESDAYLDFRSLEAEIIFNNFYKNNSTDFNLSFGYLDQSFDFIVRDLFQYNYYNDTTVEIAGDVLAYQVEYQLPYLALNVNNNQLGNGKWNYNLKFSYSPFLAAEDFDDHILRDKLIYIDADGSAYLFGAELGYQISSSLNFSLVYNYKKFEASGTQIQTNYYDRILFEDIDAEIESEQESITLVLAYRF